MGTRGSCSALLLAFALPACAQGSNSGGATFGTPFTGSSPTDDDDGSGTGDDDGETTSAGSGADDSGDGPTGGPADTSAGGASDDAAESSGAPVTASAESSSEAGPIESSDGGEASSSGGVMDEAGTDEGGMDADEWESCASEACVAGTLCINVTGLRAFSPYCAPDCVVDADCPDPGGTAPAWCALVEEGAVDPTNCAIVCSVDNLSQGTCPAGMSCADVPGQATQISVCMWP